jgi:predicted PurR-regulated permease PerM
LSAPEEPPVEVAPRSVPRFQSVVLLGILLLLCLYTLYFAQPLLVPLVLALLLTFMLNPVIRGLGRAGLPAPVGAALVLLLALGTIATGLYNLTGPATAWMERATLVEIRLKLRTLIEPFQEVQEATQQVEEMAGGQEADAETVVVQESTLGEVLLAGTGKVIASGFVVLVLAFFLLASGGRVGRDLVRALPRLGHRRRALRIGRAVEREVSRYLLTIALINAGLGATIGAAMFLLGLPNALLWGVVAGLLNFIPFIGAMVTASLLFVVALLTFDHAADALVPPLVSLALNSIEGYIITPSLIGHRLTMKPVLVFGSVFFWGWLWGVPGALLAVPLLATFKIVCDNVPALAGLGAFIGRPGVD